MKKILTFENFVPKNIEKRAKDLEIIQAKELKEYEAFVKDFEHNLELMKDKKSDDPQEQLFIDLIKDCSIKTDQEKYPFQILLFKDDKWMFKYKWKIDEFLCQYDRVWKFFKSKFNISYQNWKDFIKDMLEKYFKFRPSTTENSIIR
jgi:hypothetical protein